MPPSRRSFAKPRPAPAPANPQPDRKAALGPFANPVIGSVTAAGFFVACAVTLISLTGNPRAGAQVYHLSLAHIADTSAPPGWRDVLPGEPQGEAPYAAATVALSTAPPEDPGNPNGAAIITISDDARLEGGGASAAGAGLAQAPIAGLFAQGPGGPLPIIGADGRTPAQAYARPASTGGKPRVALIIGGLGLNAKETREAIAGLFAQGPGGPLPIIGADGRTPAQAYARPASTGGKPRVALIIGGLGLNAKETREAIAGLPPEVTLSFVPYSEGLQGWIDMARAAGHEVLLEAPMEPKDYPDNDPGPYTLMADGAPQEITRRLEWLLSRASGYFGVTNYLGSKFVASPAAMGVFASDLRQRGLAFVDDGSAARIGGGLPRASADRIVDDQLDGPAIEAQLTALETQAQRSGQALGSGFAYPVTLAEAQHWTQGLAGRNVQLVPASALMTRR